MTAAEFPERQAELPLPAVLVVAAWNTERGIATTHGVADGYFEAMVLKRLYLQSGAHAVGFERL